MDLHSFYFLLFYKALNSFGIYGKVGGVAAGSVGCLKLAVEVGTCQFFKKRSILDRFSVF